MADDIFIIQDNGTLVEMTEQAFPDEDRFQELLATYPNLLAGGQINTVSPRKWLLIKREMGIPGEEDGRERWSVDHLFLDQDAIPTLVEVKRSSDTRIRREVVGQMLDYAANAVVHWPVDKLQADYRNSCHSKGIAPDDQLAVFLAEDTTPEEFWKRVATNLQTGNIRMLFVADVIPPELRRIIEFLNEQMELAEVLGVEIKQYAGQGMKTLVPRVIGQTTEAERRKGHTPEWSTWDGALTGISNAALVSYFKQQIEAGREYSLQKRTLFFITNGKRRWSLNVKPSIGGFSGASQYARFDGDIDFWRNGLSRPEQVRLVSQERGLNFRLFTDKDYAFFHGAVTGTLQSVKWHESAGAEDEDSDTAEQ